MAASPLDSLTDGPIDLVADIGGTNIRFALTQPVGDLAALSTPLEERAYLCADFGHVTDAIDQYLTETGMTKRPRRAVFAVAGPVRSNRIAFTNSNWAFSGEEVAEKTALESVHLINDYAGKSLSLPFLTGKDLYTLSEGDPYTENGRTSYAVIGPGTGLGVGALVVERGHYTPLVSEGGHVGFAPQGDEEIAVLRILSKRYGRVSNERILSGAGLSALYRALAEARGVEPLHAEASAISSAAVGQTGVGDPLARDTLGMFYAILGSAAGDAALTYMARGGVFIAGGIPQRMPDFVAGSALVDRFIDKGRFRSMMSTIPVHMIMMKCPALIGCAVALHLMSK